MRNLQRDVEEEVAGERLGRLRDELRPQHRAPVPGRLPVDLDFDTLLCAARCRPVLVSTAEVGAGSGSNALAGFLYPLPNVSHEDAFSP